MAAEAFEGPDVLRFDVAAEVAVAGLRKDAEESLAGRIPAVFDLGDGHKGVSEFEDARRFVRLITRIADDLDRLHKFIGSRARSFTRISSDSAFHAAPRKTITAEICIQMSRPI